MSIPAISVNSQCKKLNPCQNGGTCQDLYCSYKCKLNEVVYVKIQDSGINFDLICRHLPQWSDRKELRDQRQVLLQPMFERRYLYCVWPLFLLQMPSWLHWIQLQFAHQLLHNSSLPKWRPLFKWYWCVHLQMQSGLHWQKL